MSRYEDDAVSESPPPIYKLTQSTRMDIFIVMSKYMHLLAQDPRKNLQDLIDGDKLLTELEGLKTL